MRLTVSRASLFWAISRSEAVRGISSRMQGSAARMVAPRRRPEIRPTSPKIEPWPMGTVSRRFFGLTSTFTDPAAMPNIELPMELRWKMISSGAQTRTELSSRNSRICRVDRPRRISIRVRRNSSHSATD